VSRQWVQTDGQNTGRSDKYIPPSLEQVDSFKYLGSIVNDDKTIEEETKQE
jgi:hypothetical protein